VKVVFSSAQDFLEGLSVCQAFFAETKAELMKVQSQAETAANKAEFMKASSQTENSNTLRHFRIMKKNAADINANCRAFWACMAEVSQLSFLISIIEP
jgi:hypothetical protein